jgi:hypothetical protein
MNSFPSASILRNISPIFVLISLFEILAVTTGLQVFISKLIYDSLLETQTQNKSNNNGLLQIHPSEVKLISQGFFHSAEKVGFEPTVGIEHAL